MYIEIRYAIEAKKMIFSPHIDYVVKTKNKIGTNLWRVSYRRNIWRYMIYKLNSMACRVDYYMKYIQEEHL